MLIISCIIGMIYTGGFFDGTGFVDAFAGSDASIGLMLGSFCVDNHHMLLLNQKGTKLYGLL